jgi:hypothetical protein
VDGLVLGYPGEVEAGAVLRRQDQHIGIVAVLDDIERRVLGRSPPPVNQYSTELPTFRPGMLLRR